MVNLEIRQAMRINGVFSYEVAEAMSISEATMTRKMRRELPEEEKQRILAVIERLAQEKQEVV